jgi:hypothetical protein
MVAITSQRQQLFGFIQEVYIFIYNWRMDLWRLTWPFVVLEFIYLWARFFASGGPDHQDTTAASAYYFFLALVTLVPLAARLQKFVLEPGPVTGWLEGAPATSVAIWIQAFLRYAAPVLFILCLAVIFMFWISNPADYGATPTNISIGLVMTLGLSVVMTRFVFVFPLAFVKGRSDMRRSWEMTSGQYFRLFLIIGLSTVPFRLIYRVCDVLGLYVWNSDAISVSNKLAFYFLAVFLPSTMAMMGQLVVTIVSITLLFRQIEV